MTARRLFLLIAALALLLAAAKDLGAQQPQRTVFRKVFTGITSATTSAPVTNIGQSLHIIAIFFPTASDAVTGFQVRLEGSYDNTTYFPISPDVTTAPRLGSLTYQIEKAFAPYPFIRIRAVSANASFPMTVWYTGHRKPITSAIEAQQDRFIL
jgi:hypothetical protein